jgi:hypothetical protein
MVVGSGTSVEAKTLVGLVSDRSAADLATGADHFLQHHPGYPVNLSIGLSAGADD